MEPITIGLIAAGVLIILIFLGMRIAFAAFLTGFLGLLALRDWDVATAVMGFLPHPLATVYGLTVIPMFILMGYLAHHAGLTRDIFSMARTWVGHLPGGLAITTVLGCAGFAAASGASTASAAVMGKVAIPEMRRYDYDPKLAAGVVAASGTLAVLIPPSGVLVIYAIIVEQSVSALLIAGILPGILSALIYAFMLYIRVRLNPSLGRPSPPTSLREKLISLRGMSGILVIFIIVIGGIYAGVFTPTEAGAAGAFATLLLGLLLRRFSWSSLKAALVDTGRTTIMIFILVVGILIFMRVLALSGVTSSFIEFAVALPLPPIVILISFLLLFAVLGMFLTVVSMMMLALPLVFPVIVELGYCPIWFGIIVVKMAELCLITPPIGLNVYVVHSVAEDIPLQDIFRGIWPFFLMDLLTIGVLVAFPQISLFLPNLMLR